MSHEHSTASPKPILVSAAILVGVVVLSGFATLLCLGWFRAATAEPVAAELREPAHPAPAPNLQVAPPVDMAALRANEDRALDSYGWADRGRGLARIPIDRAMALVAQGRRAAPPAAASGGSAVARPDTERLPSEAYAAEPGPRAPANTVEPGPTANGEGPR